MRSLIASLFRDISDSGIRENGRIVPVAGRVFTRERPLNFASKYLPRATLPNIWRPQRNTPSSSSSSRQYTHTLYMHTHMVFRRCNAPGMLPEHAVMRKPKNRVRSSARLMCRWHGFCCDEADLYMYASSPKAESSYKFLRKCIHNDKFGILLRL